LSPDGQQILYMSEIDLWLLPLAGERTPTAFLDTEFMEIEGQFSPDGKWVSYSSDETGRLEVYVQRYPPTGGKWQISTRGGTDARWAPDGKELVYLAPDRTLMSVQLETAGTAPMPSTPRPLFQTRISGPLGPGVRFNFVVGTDGERFLIVSDTEEASPSPIIVVLNFTAELEQ
jgi:dipeptidyl aminopeptidase/acylaminoacyl peptidase